MSASLSYPPIPGIELGPIVLSPHGVLAAIGAAVAVVLFVRKVKRTGIADPDLVASVLAWAIVGGLIGMRLFTIPARIGDPAYGWFDVIDPRGTYSMLGGIVGGLLAAGYRLSTLRLPSVALFDAAAVFLALGQAIGRIGDVMIVEHLGSPTSFFLGYTLEPGYDVSGQHDALESLCELGSCGPYHHTALYDLIGLLVLAWVLWRLEGRLRAGSLILIWAVWYGFQRFLIDFGRLGAAHDGHAADAVIGPLTATQWGGLALALAALVALVALNVRSADRENVYV